MKSTKPLTGNRLVALLLVVVLIGAAVWGCQGHSEPEVSSSTLVSSHVSNGSSDYPHHANSTKPSIGGQSEVSSPLSESQNTSEAVEKITQVPVKQVLDDVKQHENKDEPVPDTPAPPPVVIRPDPKPEWPGSSSQPPSQNGDSGYLIYLSPSNQDSNAYVNGGTEAYYMNQVALAMVPYLKASGVGYVMADMGTNLYHRAEQSDAAGCDLYLALHSNAANQLRRGTIAFYKKGRSDGSRFADIVTNNLKKISETPTEILTQYDPWEPGEKGFIETREPQAPSVLLEIAYHDNVADANWIKRNIDEIARNLAQSVTGYLGIPFRSPNDPVEVETIVVTPQQKELLAGTFATLQAVLTPENATDKAVTWSSTAPNVATVNNAGVVNALTPGEATITATSSNGKTAFCTIQVLPVEITSIALSHTSAVLTYGDTLPLTAQLEPGYATDQTVTWTTSEDTVATVSKQGVVTAVGVGTAEITATTSNGLTAVCVVTVEERTSSGSSSTDSNGSNSGGDASKPADSTDSALPQKNETSDSTSTQTE